MSPDPWDNLKAIFALVVEGNDIPVVDTIRFHYEELTQRDGTGNVCAVRSVVTGATIKVGVQSIGIDIP